MLGYVITDKAQLRVHELATYSGYYCGLCKEIGSSYGQFLRLGLSYDMAFLALILASLTDGSDEIVSEHCVIHHIAKRPVLHDESALAYATDMMMILGYENFLDDVRDGDKSKLHPMGLLLHRAYNKAAAAHPETAAQTKAALSRLCELEAKDNTSADEKAQCFADVMTEVFTGYAPVRSSNRTLAVFAANLGRWIYILDAMDDYSEDKEKGTSNPLFREGQDRRQTAGIVGPTLYHYLGEISKAYDLLDIRKNKGILDNVIYLGLRRTTDEVLSGKGRSKNGKRSI